MLSFKVKKNNDVKFAQCNIFEALSVLKDIKSQGYEVLRIDFK